MKIHGELLSLLCVWCLVIMAFLVYLQQNESVSIAHYHHQRTEHVDQNQTQFDAQPNESTRKRINACIFMLARNWEVQEVMETIRQLEKRFNHKYRYPYVIMNDELFEESFVKHVTELLNGTTVVEFGTIPKEHWSMPNWINDSKRHELWMTNFLNVGHAHDWRFVHLK